MKKRLDIGEGALIAFICFALMAVFIKGVGPSNLIITMLSVATFLFAIFGAFVMTNRHNRLDDLRKVLREDDAVYINIYRLAKLFGTKTKKKIQRTMDDYLMETLDYRLEDYTKAHPLFLKMHESIINLKPKTNIQTEAYGKMLDCINKANENRKSIEYLVRNTKSSPDRFPEISDRLCS